MKKRLALILCGAMMACFLFGCGAASNKPAETKATESAQAGSDNTEAEITLSMSHQMAASHSINATCEEFARLVKEKSGGRIAIDVYPSATLGTETENLQALTNGTLDLAVIAAEFYANYVPEAGILCLPYMYDSYEDAYNKLHSEGAEEIKSMILDTCGSRVLDYYVLAFRQIFTVDKAINNVDDLAGMIIRIPDSNTYKTTFESLGAAPTAVAWGETYTALDTGLVKAVENIPESIMSASMQEVCKYVNETNHIMGATTISISDAVYQKLSAEDQALIEECAKEATEFGYKATVDNSEANFNALTEAGLELIHTDCTALKEKIDYSKYEASQSETGKKILTSLGK